MNEFDVYREYLALKRHFNSTHFDYFKYSGKLKFSVDSFEKRKDKHFFKKLAKEKDPKNIILSNLLDSDKWIGEISYNQEAQDVYFKWMKVNQSLTYIFEKELSKIENLKNDIKVDGSHPELLKKYYRKEIQLETLIILVDVCRCYSYWNKTMKNDILWKEISLKIIKYRPFLSYDREKMKNIIKNYIFPTAPLE